MRLKVTAKDIAGGMRRSPVYCPVSRAIQRRLKKLAWVYGDEVVYQYGFRSLLPLAVRERVRAYDNGEPMEPFWFVLPRFAYRTGLA